MNHPPQPSAYGQVIAFQRTLYQELMTAGYGHADLMHLSLSGALLARYGSPQAVDQELGLGIFHGVKQPSGPFSPWRKAWSRVRQEQMVVAALKALTTAVERCRTVNLTDAEILDHIDGLVSLGRQIQPLQTESTHLRRVLAS